PWPCLRSTRRWADRKCFKAACWRIESHELSQALTTNFHTQGGYEQREELAEQIQRVIKPFDVAGLSDCSRRNWYPVKADDLFGAADKLGASRAEIEKLLSRSGFFENAPRS